MDGGPIGRRIQVMGLTCAGKSTVGQRLARALGVPFVDMDALSWQPGWVALAATDPAQLARRLREATAGDGWVVAGDYTAVTQPVLWGRLQAVVWLDPCLPRVLWRVLARSWRRWRSQELLWGTNRERFWPQLMVWRREESLIWWAVARHGRKRRRMDGFRADPKWQHIRFVRLASFARAEALVRRVEGGQPP